MTLKELSEQLNSDLVETRRRAVNDLAKISGPEALKLLIKALDDNDDNVREAAIYGLGDLKNPETLKELLKPKIIFDGNSNIRTAAIRVLGNFRKIGGLPVIEELIYLCKDPEWFVRNTAAGIIKREIDIIKSEGDTNSILSLLYILHLPDEGVHKKVIDALIEIGKEHIGILTDALYSNSFSRKSGIIRILGELKCHEGLDEIINLANHEDPVVRWEVARALGRIGGTKILSPLLKLLGDIHPKVREKAVEAISIQGKSTEEALILELKLTNNKYKKKAIIDTLGKIKSEKAILPLIDSLQDSYHLVRLAAVNAFSEIRTPEAIKQLIDVLCINPLDISQLIDLAVNSNSIRLKVRAIRALGEIKDSKVITHLTSMLITNDSDVVEKEIVKSLDKIKRALWAKICALQVLGKIKPPEALPAIMLNLEENDENIVFHALEAIRVMKSSEATNKVIELSKHSEDMIRNKAVLVLGSIGIGNPNVTDAVIERLKDNDRDIRKRAARVLGKLNDKKAIEPLKELVHSKDFWSVRRNACYALSNLGIDNYSVEEEAILNETIINCPYKTGSDNCLDKQKEHYCFFSEK